MSDPALVKVQKEPSKKQQFGKQLEFRYGQKYMDTKWAQWTSLVVLIISLAIFTVFLGAPKRVISFSEEVELNVEILKDSVRSGLAEDFPELAEKIAPPRKKNGKRITYFSGPQKMKRPKFDKIPPGSMVKAKLLTGGPIRVKTLEPLEINGNELIEEGSLLVGKGQHGQDRLYVQFSQLVFPDGSFTSIQAQAADASDKMLGLKGSKTWGHTKRLLGATALNFAAGYSEGLKKKRVENGVAVDDANAKNALLNGASSAAFELSQQEFQKLKNQPAQIQVPIGKEVYVIFGVN